MKRYGVIAHARNSKHGGTAELARGRLACCVLVFLTMFNVGTSMTGQSLLRSGAAVFNSRAAARPQKEMVVDSVGNMNAKGVSDPPMSFPNIEFEPLPPPKSVQTMSAEELKVLHQRFLDDLPEDVTPAEECYLAAKNYPGLFESRANLCAAAYVERHERLANLRAALIQKFEKK